MQKAIVVFFASMSAWLFNLLAFLLFAYSVIGGCMGDLHGAEFWKFLIASFAVLKERNMKDVWKRVSEETLYRNAGRA